MCDLCSVCDNWESLSDDYEAKGRLIELLDVDVDFLSLRRCSLHTLTFVGMTSVSRRFGIAYLRYFSSSDVDRDETSEDFEKEHGKSTKFDSCLGSSVCSLKVLRITWEPGKQTVKKLTHIWRMRPSM